MDTKTLKGRIYKILPIYENIDLNGNKETEDEHEALVRFSKYLSKLIIELSGEYSDNTPDEIKYILTTLKGMKKEYESLDHDMVKSTVFHMLSTIK